MCGIAGFAGSSSDVHEDLRATVTAMTASLAHRGPDDHGLWLDAGVPVVLGHRRLAIVDLSAAGHQPMASASGRYVLSYNGEIYNFVALRAELAPSFTFRGGSDTEIMLAAFERWGVEGALQRFNGMFAFALWDREQRCMHLACDRFGEKPLYYGLIGRRLVFASELKAIRTHPGFPAEIDRAALAAFLNHGYVPAPRSIFARFRKLEPGTWLTVRLADGAAVPGEPRAFWSAKETALRCSAKKTDISPKEATDRLEQLLEDSIRIRMLADVPVGAFLSGGIDSATIVALMQRISSGKVRTFTIGLADFPGNEAVHAAAVAKHLGVDHHELYITAQDALNVIPRLPSMYDEPFADSSQIPTFLVSQFARTGVTVSLSGDAGDELFGGYTRYPEAEATWGRVRRAPAWCRHPAAGLLGALSPAGWDTLVKPLRGILSIPAAFGEKVEKLANLLAVNGREEIYLQSMRVWPGRVPAAFPAGRTVLPGEDFVPVDDSYLAWMMFVDTMSYLPGDILCKVDRAAMAVSLESRVPFLDPAIFEFAWSLPDNLKSRDGVGKWLLRQVLYRHVPQELMDRPKTGFAVPVNHWLRGPLKEWADSLLDEKSLREGGLIDPGPVLHRWKAHLTGNRDWSGSLWFVLMFQAWLRESGV